MLTKLTSVIKSLTSPGKRVFILGAIVSLFALSIIPQQAYAQRLGLDGAGTIQWSFQRQVGIDFRLIQFAVANFTLFHHGVGLAAGGIENALSGKEGHRPAA